jgi:protease-4
MRRFIVGLLATVGTLTLLAIGGLVAVVASSPFSNKPLTKPIVLSIDLRDVPPETSSGNLLRGGLLRGSRDILDTVQLLWQAADDPRVVGLFVDIGDESAGLARVQELRQAIAHFRGKDKFAIGFAESLGSGGTHFSDYYLASALEQVWLQPSGGFAVAGIAIETPFLKAGLDKLGVQVEGGKRYQYKSAPDSFLETGYTGPARENLQQLLDSLYSQFVSDVARERRIEPAKLRQLIDSVPFEPERARQENLIDKIGYRSDALDEVRTRTGKVRDLTSLSDYAADEGRSKPPGEVVGMVRVSGAIMSGRAAAARWMTTTWRGPELGRRCSAQAADQGSARHRAAHRFAWRHLSRVRRHRRRRRPGPFGRQAGDRLDGRRGGVGRLSRRRARRRDRGPAHHHHRIDRRVRHLAGRLRAAHDSRHPGRAAGGRHQCRHVFDLPGADADAARRRLARARHDLCRIHPPGRRGAQARRRQTRCSGARYVFSAMTPEAGLMKRVGGLQLALNIAKDKANIDESRQIEIRHFPPDSERWQKMLDRLLRLAGLDAETPTLRAPREVRETLARFGIVGRPGNVRLPPLAPLWH